MVSAALASILRSGRADFNARFVAARHTHPDLKAEAFTEFLQTAVDDLLRAVERVGANRLAEVTTAAYDAALELVGQNLAGPGSRLAAVEEGWRRILPGVAPLVAAAPGRLIPAVCNAIHQLAATPEARPAQWIEIMAQFGPQCADAVVFLRLGQVSAWRAGLAHFREGAIAAADGLPEPLALAALGVKSPATWTEVRARLLDNPWHDPASMAKNHSAIHIAAQAGSFRGFGGLFVEPPLVVSSGEHFLARSSGDCWLLTADVFGATFHRASIKEFEAGECRLPSGVQVKGSRVAFNGDRLEFPALGDFTSATANATTLALTSHLTHAIVLVALK